MSWWYDEMRQVGVDFENADQVVEYDSRQGSNREAERQLIERLGISAGQFVVDLHVREEYSTFAWVFEGFLERAGFEVIEKTCSSREYAEYLCRPGKVESGAA